MTRDGVAPYWHQQADTFDKLDANVMERTWALTTALLHRLDAEALRHVTISPVIELC